MGIFGSRRNPTEARQGIAYDQIRDKLDSAFTSVFSEEGKKTVLYYLTEKYSLTLERASRDPEKLEKSLTSLLGEVGWLAVKRRILQEIYGSDVHIEKMSVEASSLGDAFGFLRSIVSAMNRELLRF